MKKVFFGVISGLAAGFCANVYAQSSYTLTDMKTAESREFTNSVGVAGWTNGTVIAFEGELRTRNMLVPAATNLDGNVFASVGLLVQVRLFDELVTSNEVGNVQGAVAALKDPPGATTGKYFAWGSTNGAPVAWVPLMRTNNTQFAVNDNATNFITFVFNYTLPTTTYQVFIGDGSTVTQLMEASTSVTSPTNASPAISGISLVGVGGLAQVASASGDPGPLSTTIGFSVYDTASGILMVVDTVNEAGTSPIRVFAWINGAWRLVGEVQSNGDGMDHRYEIYAIPGCGLVAGQSYAFKVDDDVGNSHSSSSALAITGTKMGSVIFDLDTMVITFNTEVNCDYVVKVADSPAAPKEQWTAQDVSQNIGGEWSVYTNAPFTAGTTNTSIKIPISVDKNKAFFKVFKIN